MAYTVTGIGAADARLVYEKETLPEDGYLASRMADNGVAEVRIRDDKGSDISLEQAWEAFRQDPPSGWTIR